MSAITRLLTSFLGRPTDDRSVRQPTRLGVESLEGRELMAAGPYDGPGAWAQELLHDNGTTRSRSSYENGPLVLRGQGFAGPEAGDYAGHAVATDGDTLVVGAPYRNGMSGAVWVYVRDDRGTPLVRSDDTWARRQSLWAGGARGFGWSVAVSGDTIAVGAPYSTVNGLAGAGLVYVYARQDNGTPDFRGDDWWQARAPLSAAAPGYDELFGYSVSLGGGELAVGAPQDRQKGGKAGAAYLFGRDGDGWRQAAKLTAADGAAGDELGTSVALTGGALLAGAPWKGGTGAVYAFGPSGEGWEQQKKIVPTYAQARGFGWAVTADGGTAVVGSFLDDGGAGAAYVYDRAGGAWSGGQRLTSGVPGGQFGYAVAVGNGQVVVGAPGQGAGAAYVYARRPGEATWGREDLAGAAAGDRFGAAVAVGANAVAVGARGRDAAGGDSGAAYVYARDRVLLSAESYDPKGPMTSRLVRQADGTYLEQHLDAAGETWARKLLQFADRPDEAQERVWSWVRRADGLWREEYRSYGVLQSRKVLERIDVADELQGRVWSWVRRADGLWREEYRSYGVLQSRKVLRYIDRPDEHETQGLVVVQEFDPAGQVALTRIAHNGQWIPGAQTVSGSVEGQLTIQVGPYLRATLSARVDPATGSSVLSFGGVQVNAGRFAADLLGNVAATLQRVTRPLGPLATALARPVCDAGWARDIGLSKVTPLSALQTLANLGYVGPDVPGKVRGLVDVVNAINALPTSLAGADGWVDVGALSGRLTGQLGDAAGRLRAIGVSLPVFDRPAEVLPRLLAGENVTLFSYTLSAPAIDVTRDVALYTFVNPTTFTSVDAGLTAHFALSGQVTFGLDASGFRAGDLLGGLFVQNAELTATFSAGAYGRVVQFGVVGYELAGVASCEARVGLTRADSSGKVYLGQLLNGSSSVVVSCPAPSYGIIGRPLTPEELVASYAQPGTDMTGGSDEPWFNPVEILTGGGLKL